MESNTSNAKMEMVSKWYQFYFYEDYFECYWKSGFIKKNRKVFYKDILDVSCNVVTVNFTPCYTYKINVAGQKSLELGANFRKQLENLVPAIEYIKSIKQKYDMQLWQQDNNHFSS